jgi:DNA-binding transcriptional LysR family regulator
MAGVAQPNRDTTPHRSEAEYGDMGLHSPTVCRGDRLFQSNLTAERSMATIDHVELRDLEIVVALSEELHFGRTAERVHLSQPALTQALARLEARLGAQLFQRSSRRVALTPAGAALVPRARALLEQNAEAADLVARVARGEEGSVRLGVVGSAMLDLLPQLVRAVRKQHPGIELEITEAIGAEQVASLRAGRLDLGILHVELAPDGLAVMPLRSEPLAVALPADHRLADRKVLRLHELRDEPLVVQRRAAEADTQGRYLQACADAGFAARVAQEVGSLQALLGFVAAGLGWAFVARSLVGTIERTGVRLIALSGTAARLPTALAWNPGRLSPPAALVRDVARTSVR